MKIASIGGGPAGLFFAILRKKRHPEDDVVVYERNAKNETFGWGVVFSDETLTGVAEADPDTYAAITRRFVHWDAIDVFVKGERFRSEGHGFAGISRRELLELLEARALEVGVRIEHRSEVADVSAVLRDHDLVLGADGVKSTVRAHFEAAFAPSIELRSARYIWLGTKRRLESFTFAFESDAEGTFQAHAYPFDASTSTFIVECDEASFFRSGFDRLPVEAAIAALERRFAAYLGGERLLSNRSSWIQFPVVKNATWHHGRTVLLGDAAHTAHYSIGSGTKLALEDAIALATALERTPAVGAALAAYEAERRPVVERTQKAALDSLVLFENIPRYAEQAPIEFAFNLMTRSKRITWGNLRVRDPELVERVGRRFAELAATAADRAPPPVAGPLVPPMFAPLRLRGLVLENRVVVSPMCMYSAEDGTPNDFHLVHLGARALGGAGLVFTEMTDVSADGRISPGCTGMYAPEHVAAWRRIVDFVHAHGASKIGLQLGHAGRKGATRRMWEGMDEPLESGGWPLLSASALPWHPHSAVPKAMDRGDMDRVLADFVRAARMGDEAGFDLLELHFAHGYLLASFLSPLTNHRTDAYGGPIEARLRYPLEVFDAVRAAWPADKPMSVRISASDWAPGGITPADALYVARTLKTHGLDLLDVSSGQTSPASKPVYGRMWQAPFSDHLRHEAKIATMTVGGIANADQVNTLLAAGRADLCALARTHLDDPNFTLHAAMELGVGPRWPAPYGPAATVPRERPAGTEPLRPRLPNVKG